MTQRNREDSIDLFSPMSGFEVEETPKPQDFSKYSGKNIVLNLDGTSSFLAENTEESAEKGYLMGALMMVITTTLWSAMHVATKIMYTRSPEMTGYDTVSVMGYALLPVYYFYAKSKKVNIDFFSFERKVQLILIARVVVGLANNAVLFAGLRYISVGKGILIFSLSPLFWAVTAGILLKERITFQTAVLILCSFGGVYLLTLNKSKDPAVASKELLGYFLVTWSAFLYGLLFVIFRKMNLYNINILISPLTLGVGTWVQNLFLAFFTTGYLHFELYTGYNLVWLGIVAGTAVIGQFTMIKANKYSAASRMAPIGYAENVVTLLADSIIFGYHFVLTDFVGIVIIIVWIAIPVIQKLKA